MCKTDENLFLKYIILILMTAIGFTADVKEIIPYLSVSNLIIVLSIVLGAVIVIMLLAKKMSFYTIESAITAWFYMANRSGAGYIAVLGAADLSLWPLRRFLRVQEVIRC